MPLNTSIKPKNTKSVRARVLAAINRRTAQGATSDEIESLLGLTHQSVSARLTELYNEGQVYVAGTRKTRSGRPANIYHGYGPDFAVDTSAFEAAQAF